MTTLNLLDRIDPSAAPLLRNAADVRAVEATPYAERIAAQSTFEALQRGAAHAPAAPALHFLTRADPDETPLTVSGAQLISRITQTANLFGALGVGAGDVVSLLLPLIPQSFYALFGAQAAGIANPVNPLLSAAQIAEILRAAGTKVLVALGPVPGSDIWDKVQQIRGELPGLKAIVVVNGAADPANGVLSFDALIDSYPGNRLSSGRQIAAHDTAAYFHTGGTTGTPKLVRHTHGNQVYQAWVINTLLPNRAGASLLFGLPLFHVGGALTQGLAPLSGGGNLVIVAAAGWREPNAVRNVWRLVERYRPVVFGGVPTVLAAALGVPPAGADVSSIECVSGGGSAIPVAVCRAYVEWLGKPVLEVYGMTETSSVHTLSFAQAPLRLGSVGYAVPYSRVRIVKVDAQGRCVGDCAADEIGVVAMSGPGVFSGYLSDVHNRSAFVETGWVNSGDLGRLDADGYLWITGRAKDLIIRGGHNIDPQAIEEVFYGHPSVALAAVVGQPDAYAGELPVAFVQLKAGASVEPNELIDFVRERTPEHAAVPVKVTLIDAMPLTAVGKVFKPALRLDAARAAVTQLLAGLAPPGAKLGVEVGAHAKHGSVITVVMEGVAQSNREAVEKSLHERLDPLVMAHRIVWR